MIISVHTLILEIRGEPLGCGGIGLRTYSLAGMIALQVRVLPIAETDGSGGGIGRRTRV